MLTLQRITRSILWRTGLGRKAAAAFWFKKRDGSGIDYVYFNSERVFDTIPTDFTDKEYSEFIKKDSARNSQQMEFIVEIADVIVEPERCLGIQNFRDLVEQTIVIKYDYQYPYILPYLLNRKKVINMERAVLYDGSATSNYYHHFVDAVNSLYVLHKKQQFPDIPFIINRQIFNSSYFQFLYKQSKQLQAVNWLVQEPDQWFKVKKLYKCQSLPFSTEPWVFTRQLYSLPTVEPVEKVFLNRDKRKVGRYLSNEEEVEVLLQKYGFKTVFAEQLKIEEQAALFQKTKYLVALTGAGLIQQFFMNWDQGHVIEIMPRNRLMPEYYWQAYTLKMKYYDVVVGDAMVGGKDTGKGYYLDPSILEQALIKMLTNTNEGRTYGNTPVK